MLVLIATSDGNDEVPAPQAARQTLPCAPFPITLENRRRLLPITGSVLRWGPSREPSAQSLVIPVTITAIPAIVETSGRSSRTCAGSVDAAWEGSTAVTASLPS